MKKRKITKYLQPLFETSSEMAEWFGYYNYDTLNHDKTKLLCNRSHSESNIINKGSYIEVGYYDIPNGSWNTIGQSDSWNWQQGCMAQWIPGKGNENKVIYNCSKENHLTSCIHDISTGENRYLDWSIYGLTPDGKFSISLDLERSYWCRAYHYASVINESKEGRIVHGDGVYKIDLINNTRDLLISIEDIVGFEPDDDFGTMKHWIEHIMVSPSGKQFCFLHRYSPIDNVLKYKTRLFVANIDGSSMQVIHGWNSFTWSHFGWATDDMFVIYAYKLLHFSTGKKEVDQKGQRTRISSTLQFRLKEIIRQLLPKSIKQKLRGSRQYYQLYLKDSNGVFQLRENISGKMMEIDGHPSFTSDGVYMITDSYPDYRKMRRLFVYNLGNKKRLLLGEFPENSRYNNAECDLHPKLCKDNSIIGVDTTSTGHHHLALYTINWDKVKKELE